ncbi:MAG: class B sortase [Oscillospiraceae bacterium]|nr:class B sortase [Oscillospiraceae bacterium]
MKSKSVKAIKGINGIINYAVLIVVILLFLFAAYALWDSNQLYAGADKSNYSVYKPTPEDQGKSFAELVAINPEVFAWLTVYGTSIDYPVTQGPDNMKYVNTSAEGRYSLSGAIFLDSRNSKDFSDFNSIIYGHHMAKNVMFGEIDDFRDKEKFEAHRYGSIYYDGQYHQIEFFAFLHTDAYDGEVFSANVNESERGRYLESIFAKSLHIRDIGVTTNDRIILLSTCSADSTNGRDILAGIITDEPHTQFREDVKDEGSDNSSKTTRVTLSNYSFFTVLTTSMQKEIPQGSLIVTVRTDPAKLQIGDNITFMKDYNTAITHKITDIYENHQNSSQRGFQTKGTDNDRPDEHIVLEMSVVGKVVLVIPAAGAVMEFIAKNLLLFAAAIIFGVIATILIKKKARKNTR